MVLVTQEERSADRLQLHNVADNNRCRGWLYNADEVRGR